MLDRFVYGDVDRISPEAPVPVLRLSSTNRMLGGVGNVARNIASLGGEAVLISCIGKDIAGAELRALISEAPRVVDACVVTDSRSTICKTRLIASQQHIARLDEEVNTPILPLLEQEVLATLAARIDGAQAVILSDYAKGLLTPLVVRGVIAQARARDVPVFCDPKQEDVAYYRGTTVITPNLKELRAATRMPVSSDEEVVAAAKMVLKRAEAAAVVVTRSEKGMTLLEANGEVHMVSAVAREVFDVSGAGDTVIAVLALAGGKGLPLQQAMRIANAAAGVVVSKLGTATLTRVELQRAVDGRFMLPQDADEKFVSRQDAVAIVEAWRRQGLVVGFTNGCFDILHSGHVSLLRAARQHCDRLVVALNTDASVSRLKGPARPINSLEDRAAVIEALHAVDLVLSFPEDTPLEAIKAVRPDRLFKGADYRADQVVGAAEVEANGGHVVLLPLIEGRSTTLVIEKSRHGLHCEVGSLVDRPLAVRS